MCCCAQYNTYSTHYRETDCLRQMVEPFLYNAGVDIVLHGEHFHHAMAPWWVKGLRVGIAWQSVS